jgi:uncharacterized protein (TIGR03435 family)
MKAAICLLATALILPAQSRPAAAAAFEVASIKVATSGINGVNGGCHGIDSVYSPRQQGVAPPLGRCVITDARLSHLIGIAWGVSMMDMKSGPDWIQRGDLRFDVQAKAEDPAKTTEKQLLAMLQALIMDRFQLKFHWDKTEVSGFALLPGKNGTKLRPSTADEMKISFTGRKGESVKPGPGQPISMTAVKCPIFELVQVLSRAGSRGPGVDETGLTGEYDFKLSWDDDAGPALVTALRDQLGLRLESEKVTVSTFVVDSAVQPSAN